MEIDALDLANRIVLRYITTWKRSQVTLNAPETPIKMVRKGKRLVPSNVSPVKRKPQGKKKKRLEAEKDAYKNRQFQEAVSRSTAYSTKGGAVASLAFSSYPEDGRDRKWGAEVDSDGNLKYKTKKNDLSRLDNMILEEIADWAVDSGLQVSVSSDGGSFYEDND